jgi:hypothetical protein
MQVAINTVFSLTGSCVTTFLLSGFVGRGKYNMMHIQNASLAGGVAMGAPSPMLFNPAFSFIIGMYMFVSMYALYMCVCVCVYAVLCVY